MYPHEPAPAEQPQDPAQQLCHLGTGAATILSQLFHITHPIPPSNTTALSNFLSHLGAADAPRPTPTYQPRGSPNKPWHLHPPWLPTHTAPPALLHTTLEGQFAHLCLLFPFSTPRTNTIAPTDPETFPLLTALLTSLLATLTTLLQQALRLFLALTLPQRVLVLCAGAVLFALGVVFLVYSHRIFAALGPVAASWRATPGGWIPIWLATVATGFPPVIGYSTCVTVAGFVYGFPLGWPIAASATVVGSTAAFLTSRGVFAGYVQRLVGGDKRFIALGQVLRRDGIAVLVMIRLCPLPYSLSNGFLATVGSIQARGFALATAAATYVFLFFSRPVLSCWEGAC